MLYNTHRVKCKNSRALYFPKYRLCESQNKEIVHTYVLLCVGKRLRKHSLKLPLIKQYSLILVSTRIESIKKL